MKNPRLISLDVFRGLTIALMIVVNNPGSWSHIHPPLRHATWHGLTPTDLVFPFFLFIVGVAMALSFTRRQEQGAERSDLIRKILVRSGLIFACGLLLNGYPFGLPLSGEAAATFTIGDIGDSLVSLRFMGVLQRIALCYLIVGLTVVRTDRIRTRALVGLAALLLYELLMRLPLVDGWGAGSLALENNFVRWLDLRLLGEAHLWRGAGLPFDPEGLVSTLPAIATTLAGYFAGCYLRHQGDAMHKVLVLAGCGVGLTITGSLLHFVEPVNKQLWTTSYVVVTAGLALLTLALSLWLIDIKNWRRAVQPAVVFGSNPLVVFVGSGLLARTLGLMRVGEGVSVQRWLYLNVFQPLAGDVNGSLLHATFHVLLWLAILWWLYRRRIFVRI